MRTNIVIDEKLMADAMEAAGVKTKRAAVLLGLEGLIKRKAREELRNMRGKINWIGDLDAMRTD